MKRNRISSIRNSSLWITWSIWSFLDIFSFARKTWRAKVFSWRLGNLSARAMRKCDARFGSTTHGVHICHLKHTASQVTWRQRRPIFRGHFMDSSLLYTHPYLPLYKNFPFHYLFAFYFTQMGMNSTFCFSVAINYELKIAGTQMATTFYDASHYQACFLLINKRVIKFVLLTKVELCIWKVLWLVKKQVLMWVFFL